MPAPPAEGRCPSRMVNPEKFVVPTDVTLKTRALVPVPARTMSLSGPGPPIDTLMNELLGPPMSGKAPVRVIVQTPATQFGSAFGPDVGIANWIMLGVEAFAAVIAPRSEQPDSLLVHALAMNTSLVFLTVNRFEIWIALAGTANWNPISAARSARKRLRPHKPH